MLSTYIGTSFKTASAMLSTSITALFIPVEKPARLETYI